MSSKSPSPAELVLQKGSRSFSFASRFLPAERREDAAELYAFCRLVDDLGDDAPSPEQGKQALDELQQELRGGRVVRPEVEQLLRLSRECNVPLAAADELVAGVRSDLEAKVRIQSEAELLRYAYRVAGTVGLMMCGVLGVRVREAIPFAIDLGIAMQLSNIARDVLEDAHNDRLYLPAELVLPHEEPGSPLVGQLDPARVSQTVRTILELAERYYQSADAGLHFIPFRARVAILVASRVYRRIGRVLLGRGANALEGRTVVSFADKVLTSMAAGFLMFRPKFWGWQRPRHRVELHRALLGLPGASG